MSIDIVNTQNIFNDRGRNRTASSKAFSVKPGFGSTASSSSTMVERRASSTANRFSAVNRIHKQMNNPINNFNNKW